MIKCRVYTMPWIYNYKWNFSHGDGWFRAEILNIVFNVYW